MISMILLAILFPKLFFLKVSVFDKSQGKQVEKSVSELSKEDIDELRKMAQPKTMEELAKDQLSYLDSITTSVLSIQDMVGLGLSRAKTGEEILSTPAKYAKIIDDFAKDNKTNSEAIKNMITEQRGSVDKLVQEGFVKNCIDTDDETEFEIQDIIFDELLKSKFK